MRFGAESLLRDTIACVGNCGFSGKVLCSEIRGRERERERGELERENKQAVNSATERYKDTEHTKMADIVGCAERKAPKARQKWQHKIAKRTEISEHKNPPKADRIYCFSANLKTYTYKQSECIYRIRRRRTCSAD